MTIYDRIKEKINKKINPENIILIDNSIFHTKHKFLLLSHSRKHYDIMGKLVANAKLLKVEELKARYSKLFMEALTYKSTQKKNTNVLLYMTGLLKKS